MTKQKHYLKKLNLQNVMAVIVVLLITIIGIKFLISSNAQSPYVSTEADSGNVAAPATIQSCTGTSNGRCVRFGVAAPPAVSFSVVGNKIMESNGVRFVPYGFVLPCAANYATRANIDGGSLCNGSDSDENSATDFIKAAAQTWNANIIRIQVSQEDLFSETTHDTCSTTSVAVNQNYVNLINNLVTQVNSYGMVAIITLQEELAGGCSFPTASSTQFWQYMANVYKNNPDVFFDLYNEPQLGANAAGSEDNIWNIWQNGGTATAQTDSSGIGTGTITYVGMQSLINTIRAAGANNIVIAEGNAKDQDLTELSSHYLSGSNIAYGTEPSLRSDGAYKDITEAEWNKNWGQYAATVPIMPEAFLDQYGTQACDPNSETDIPALFAYLKGLGIGLISWTLDPGVDIQGTSLSTPTTFSGVSIVPSYCPDPNGDTSSKNIIGPGQLIQQYFIANSQKLIN